MLTRLGVLAPPTCLTAVRLVSVPRLLLSVMTMAWDSRLDGWYWGESDLAYTEKKDGMVRESCLDLIPDKM